MKKVSHSIAAVVLCLSTGAFAKPSIEVCLGNLKADLNKAVQATNNTDPVFGVSVIDFSYSGVSNDGDGIGNKAQYLMTMKLNQSGQLQEAVGTVLLNENCEISGMEKVIGLAFKPVFMKLK